MKHFSFTGAVILILALCSFDGGRPASGNSGLFKIIMQLNGLNNGAKAYLLTVKEEELYKPKAKFLDTITSAFSENGKIELTGTLDGNGQRFAIALEGKREYVQLLVSEHDQVVVSGNESEWPAVDISGSKGTSQMIAYKKFLLETLNSKSSGKEMNEHVADYMNNHRQDLYTPFALLQYENMTPDEKLAVYNNLSEASRTCFYGLVLAEAFQKNRLLMPVREGKEVRDFSLIMLMSGDTMRIKQLAAKNRLTLIEFWSTACKPCIAGFPFLKEVYAKYHGKGLEILGITSTWNTEYLRKAVRDHWQLPWLQALDNVDHAFNDIFKLSGVPDYVLIDQEGKLIAFQATNAGWPSFGPGIFGNELIKTLDEYLK